MEDPPPWKDDYHTISQKVIAVFESISKGPGKRSDKVRDFIAVVGALYSMERVKVTWPKRQQQAKELYKTLERRREALSPVSPDLPKPAADPLTLAKTHTGVPVSPLGFWDRREYKRQLERAKRLGRMEGLAAIADAVSKQDEVGFRFPDPLGILDRREQEVHRRFKNK